MSPSACSSSEERLLVELENALGENDVRTARDLVVSLKSAHALHAPDLVDSLFLCCERGHEAAVKLLLERPEVAGQVHDHLEPSRSNLIKLYLRSAPSKSAALATSARSMPSSIVSKSSMSKKLRREPRVYEIAVGFLIGIILAAFAPVGLAK